MRQPQYKYNPKTLRYERVRFSVWRFIGSFVSYAAFACLFFIALNMLQNAVIETDLEKSLRQENNDMTTYKASLTGELDLSTNLLKDLQHKETHLYQELFDAPAEKGIPSKASLPNTEDTKSLIELLQNRAAQIKEKSQTSNYIWSEYASVDKSDLPDLFNTPSAAPVAGITPDNLVSGFGVRINPFHKAKFHHDGIDLSFTKGTDVLATGNGVVYTLARYTNEGGIGNFIDIDHGNGIISRYAHLHDVNVNIGQKIKKGQKIGTVGNSGNSAAPHLHYEIIKDGKNVNPMFYMVEDLSTDMHNNLVIKSKTLNQSLD
ncbi:MAG: M23 family metallopeptidase [Bacteroidetes bacterium]|nr:M23 family metallopeptidase [Bacteroidota bacterium]MBS1539800.1 M23 family metallopeptidase [Bacteroidota bacterium]